MNAVNYSLETDYSTDTHTLNVDEIETGTEITFNYKFKKTKKENCLNSKHHMGS